MSDGVITFDEARASPRVKCRAASFAALSALSLETSHAVSLRLKPARVLRLVGEIEPADDAEQD
jgi:uncharacterized protein involved in propanediol utilization